MSLKRVKQVPFATKWIISEKELTAMKDTVNGRLHSSFASTTSCDGGGAKYCLVIYPNGNRDGNRGKVMICFGLQLGSLKEVNAKYTITTQSANVSLSVQHVFKKSDGWGKCFCDTTDMFNPEKRFFVDGKMTLKVYGMLEYNVDDDGAKFPITLGHELWDDDYGKDFKLVVDGNDLKVHKVILASASPVFAELFKPGTKEAAENQLIISDFAYNVVDAAMKGIYAYHYLENYNNNIINALIQFFDKYNITYLKDLYSSLLLRLNGKEPLKDDGITKFEKIDDKNTNVTITRFPIGDKLWANDVGKDYKFIVEGKEIKVHKLILSKRFFAAMFKTKEGAEIDQTIVTDFSYNDVEKALKIVYECPSFFKSFKEENVAFSKLYIKYLPSFLQFYEKYNFPFLKDMLETTLIDHISAETVCYLSNCSITSNATKLQERCVEFMKIASASKIPLTDFNILDKEIISKVSENPIYAEIRTPPPTPPAPVQYHYAVAAPTPPQPTPVAAAVVSPAPPVASAPANIPAAQQPVAQQAYVPPPQPQQQQPPTFQYQDWVAIRRPSPTQLESDVDEDVDDDD